MAPRQWRKNTQNFYPKDRPLIFGHRGSPSQITENTISSFEKALEQGVDGLEFDVRLTRDKKVLMSLSLLTSRQNGELSTLFYILVQILMLTVSVSLQIKNNVILVLVFS